MTDFTFPPLCCCGYAMTQLVEAQRYKPEGAGSIPYCVIGIFLCLYSSGRTMAVWVAQVLKQTRAGA
jgi:hypothetical protein